MSNNFYSNTPYDFDFNNGYNSAVTNDVYNLNSDVLQLEADLFAGSNSTSNSNYVFPQTISNSQIIANLSSLQVRTDGVIRRAERARAALNYIRNYIANGGTITSSQRARISQLVTRARSNAVLSDRVELLVDRDLASIINILRERNICPTSTPIPCIPIPTPYIPTSNTCGCSNTLGAAFNGY